MLNGIKEKRVGFVLIYNEDWLGGLNYFKNLFSILIDNEDLNIVPVVFTNNKKISKYLENDKILIVECKCLERSNFVWMINKIISRIFDYNICLNYFFYKYNVDIISHNFIEGSRLPQIGWIPDFQHKYLKNLFSNKEMVYRDSIFKKYFEKCNLVLLSSETAKKDAEVYYNEYRDKCRVLKFVSNIDLSKYNRDILKKYSINKPFFYLPNQFWQHKNHKLVLKALLEIRDENILIVCTGNTNDYRNLNYFKEIKQFIKKYKLDSNFLILGIVPLEDVYSLMIECKAIIQPSLFEGWSSIVEEAKVLNKKIILSDIDVHLEQNPTNGIYFSSNNVKDLAEKILTVWNEDDKFILDIHEIEKRCKMNQRLEAIDYRRIIDEIGC